MQLSAAVHLISPLSRLVLKGKLQAAEDRNERENLPVEDMGLGKAATAPAPSTRNRRKGEWGPALANPENGNVWAPSTRLMGGFPPNVQNPASKDGRLLELVGFDRLCGGCAA